MWSSLGYDVTFWAKKTRPNPVLPKPGIMFFFFSFLRGNHPTQTLWTMGRHRRQRRPPVSEQEAKGSGSQKRRRTKRTRRKSQAKEETGKDKRRRWETERRKPTERNTTADRKNQAKAPAKGTTRQSAVLGQRWPGPLRRGRLFKRSLSNTSALFPSSLCKIFIRDLLARTP